MTETYAYCWVRRDLSLAQQMVQVGHACAMAEQKFGGVHGANLVLCCVRNQAELVDGLGKLVDIDVNAAMFYERDTKEFTAICTEPLSGLARDALKFEITYDPDSVVG